MSLLSLLSSDEGERIGDQVPVEAIVSDRSRTSAARGDKQG